MNGRIDSVSRVIFSTPRLLYQAFMTPYFLVQWMPPDGMTAEIDSFHPEVGKGYRMTLTYGDPTTTAGKTSDTTDMLEMTFVELVPDKKIAGKATFETEDPDILGEMLMSWYFEEVNQGTKVTILVENVPVGISKADHIEGLNSTLDNLEKFLQRQ